MTRGLNDGRDGLARTKRISFLQVYYILGHFLCDVRTKYFISVISRDGRLNRHNWLFMTFCSTNRPWNMSTRKHVKYNGTAKLVKEHSAQMKRQRTRVDISISRAKNNFWKHSIRLMIIRYTHVLVSRVHETIPIKTLQINLLTGVNCIAVFDTKKVVK